jgi:hypothetical protein
MDLVRVFTNRSDERQLVESDEGIRYSNGRHYLKFYIPVGMLRAVSAS